METALAAQVAVLVIIHAMILKM